MEKRQAKTLSGSEKVRMLEMAQAHINGPDLSLPP